MDRVSLSKMNVQTTGQAGRAGKRPDLEVVAHRNKYSIYWDNLKAHEDTVFSEDFKEMENVCLS